MRPKTRHAMFKALAEVPWAIQPSALSRIVDWARQAPDALETTAGSVIRERPFVALDGGQDGAVRSGGVAVIPVYGVIEYRSDWMIEWFGGCSVESIGEAIQSALADPTVTAILLDIDSPGGTVAGITELATWIRSVRGSTKPIVASANTLAASAAYWIASQADECVVTPSGMVGSIGVYAMHQEYSRMLDEAGIGTTLISAGPHKTEGNAYEPLSDDAKADIQARVDVSYGQFLGDVAAGRRVAVSDVEANFGGGRVLTAKAAQSAGMVDRVETLSQTIQRLGSAGGRRRVMSAESAAVELEAAATPTADAPDAVPFTERIEALALEATELVGHASERARLRAKEGRPAFSTTTERSLRSIREAIDGLLEPVDPDASASAPEPAVDPPPVAAVKPLPAAPTPARFQSRDDWLQHLEATT